jgi:DNA topoisomerase I
MQLVIVESPTKARKLSSYLGSGYQVEASVGHIRDLPKSGLGVDVEKNFEPTYAVNPDKKKVLSKLTTALKTATTVILATDPDREGEAIAWHLFELLKDTKKDSEGKFVRASFHEITKQAVLKAIENPGHIDMSLVNAQQARRILDRLVGYQVSPVLWKKIRRGLSAGRVQSVALRLIVEREREILAFVPEEFWEVDVALSATQSTTPKALFIEGAAPEQLPENVFISRVAEVNGKKFLPTTAEHVAPLQSMLPTAEYRVAEVELKQRKRQSVPPFSTSTLQQASSSRFGYSSKNTMRLAQQLYEEGLITYHRTDAISLSQSAMAMAREYIEKKFGAKYLPPKSRQFSTKTKNAQEAHEAIRVTDVFLEGPEVLQKSSRFSAQHVKLYDLIWRRFVASQMEAALYDQTSITIEATASAAFTTSENPAEVGKSPATSSTNTSVGSPARSATLKTTGSILRFDGWMKLGASREDSILPELTADQKIGFIDHNYGQKFTQPPARYNDASVVKELEKRGIGRPSTYASIISVIEDRGYVERMDKRFVATAVGMTVNDFLVEHFPEFMEYEFTAEMEEDLDRISRGEKEWQSVLSKFYIPFNKRVENVTETADRMQVPVESTGEKCPDCEAGEIVIRTGRFGKFKSCSTFPECKYTQNIVDVIEGVTCPLCGEGSVTAKQSRWGKSFFGCGRYPDCNWASWKKPEPGETVTKEEWAVLQAAREERKKKFAERRGGTAAAAKKVAAKKSATKKTSAKKSVAKKSTSTTAAKTQTTKKTKTTKKRTTTKKTAATKAGSTKKT